MKSIVMSLSAVAAAISLSARADDCVADWGAAGEIVRREKLLTVQQVAADVQGAIVKATLCKGADGFVYQLVVREPDGRLSSAVAPAKGR